MNNQFKNPLPRKDSSAPQSDAWLTGGAQPATPGDQSQGNYSPNAQPAPGFGGRFFRPPWKPGAQAPLAPAFADQQTRKQPSFAPGADAFGGPGSLPLTPEAYGQGQHGPYGSGATVQQKPSSFQNGPQGPASFANGGPGMGGNLSMFAPPQGPLPGGPRGTGNPGNPGFGGPASFAPQGGSLFNQANPGSAFSFGALAPPPAPLPGTFSPDRRVGTGALGDKRRDFRDGRRAGPPRKDPPGGKRRKKRRVPIWARVVIGFLLTLIVLGAGGFVYYETNFAGQVNNIVGQTVPRAKGEGDPNSNLTNGILTGPRVNILLLGSDTDQKFRGSYIAQTDIVVTIDPSSNTVGMLSIPRDFYIPVPGYGLHKLDEAYGLGGVALSRATIEQDFGIKINYYAWVGLDGFIKVINEVGGVDVDVLHPIVDDNYPDDVGKNADDPYAVKRLYLAPGPQHLDGPSALEYVRSRHADLVGDFGRSVRQQQVLTALKTKLANPNIFGKLSGIAKDLQGYLKTDMQLPDVLKLMNFARSLDPAKISKLTLGPPYSSSGIAPQGTPDAGASVVFPNCALIVPAIQKMLALGSNAACNVSETGDPANQPLTTYTPTVGLAPTMSPVPSPMTGNSANANGSNNLGNQFSNAVSSLGSDPADLFGVRSLLELLLMGTFESTSVF